jgi:beta-lactamase superfamily II metal-dependent hydrolase
MHPPHPRSAPVLPALLLLFLVVTCAAIAGCTTGTGHGSTLDQNTTGDLRAYFLDVGQGDASVILFKDKVIVIDSGEVDQSENVVTTLRELGVKKIDLLVATHPHSDHIGGMQNVLENFKVVTVLDSGTPSTSPLYERFLKMIEKQGITYIAARQGQTIDIDPSLRILVLSPPEDRTSDDLNANSIVLRISYGTVNLLYAGDATASAEEAITKTGYPLDAQVLKVGHHGSSGSSSASFLSRVNPDIAVIPVGNANDYGHPHKATLDRLAAVGSMVFRTDTDGTIRVTSDGSTIGVATEKGDAGFWNAAVYATTPAPVIPVMTAVTTHTLPVATPDIANHVPAIPSNLTLPNIQLGNASSVYISAVQFDAPGDDRTNLNGEWVRIANRGTGPVLIAGWTLSDRTNTSPYTFPALVLLPEESVTVYTGSGMMNDTAIFMGRSSPIFGNNGDVAILRDGAGTIIDQSNGTVTS